MMPKLIFVFDRKGQATSKKVGVVELRITSDRKRKYISTGIQLLPKEWSNGSVVGRKDWKELNKQLQVIYSRCSEIITQTMEDGTFDLNSIPVLLKNSMMQKMTFLDYFKEFTRQRSKDIRKSTLKRYSVVYDFLERWSGMVNFADITEANIKKMERYLTDKGLRDCSIYNYHKIIKPCVRQAFHEGLIKSNPYERVKVKRGESNGLARFLTPDEFRKLERSPMPTKSLEQIRDVFVFQTYTMLSYSDLADFDYRKAKTNGNSMVYTGHRIKTGKEFTFMLMDRAIDILEKYKYRLPIISNQKYNMLLKSVANHAGIYKSITTHYARHTGATMLLNEGKVSYEVIAKILGDTVREVEKTYAKMLDDTVVESMESYQRKSRKETERSETCLVVSIRSTRNAKNQ